jgi:hypothetical protein
MTLDEATERRAQIVARMEEISAAITSEGRKNMTASEDEEFSRLQVEIATCKKVQGYFGSWPPVSEREVVNSNADDVLDVGELRREAFDLEAALRANRCGDLLDSLNYPPNPVPLGYYESIRERLDNFQRGLACNFV